MDKVTRIDDNGVEIYNHPNPEIKSFLTMVALSVPRVEIFKKPLDTEAQNSLSRLGLIASQIVKDIMAVPGVQEIHLKPKEIRIKKELSSSWGKIEKPVVEILKRALRRKKMKLVR